MLPLRLAAICLWISGVGFGLPCLAAIRNLLAGRGIPMILGFPAYGGGPFERHGIRTTGPLLVAFMVVCALECVAGWLVWTGEKRGAVLAAALLPLGGVFWWGFALPFGPLFAVVRTVLIIVGWRVLR
jgi:hypothetical protein